MNVESVVIAGQQTAVNTFSDLVHTAHQARKVGGGQSPVFTGLSQIQRSALSCNKVSVLEGADGSPPFWSDYLHPEVLLVLLVIKTIILPH